ncbi:hypothetical protein PPTG_22396 [Phytophthora nicotianae INRA-310]|uniref:Uncharacterized protein n=1 Tax=Phytophthora nicotianae (strain INRA-310) TaxID=761204 RepID=W2QKG4_PHYN3|nr:hypothetical protein PPTG_22396 [Phytophthora nicotianae INRA-310]ETN12730.1 hypothetical protein PPTG_22396 [Phytophthora nicotianae INRA-310]
MKKREKILSPQSSPSLMVSWLLALAGDSRGSMSLSAADDGGDITVFHWYTHAALQKRSDNFPES